MNELRKKRNNPVTPLRSITIFQPSYYRRYPLHPIRSTCSLLESFSFEDCNRTTTTGQRTNETEERERSMTLSFSSLFFFSFLDCLYFLNDIRYRLWDTRGFRSVTRLRSVFPFILYFLLVVVILLSLRSESPLPSGFNEQFLFPSSR